MDYQEAIDHCKEVSRKNRKNNVRNTIVIPNHWISSAHCAEEHEQLAKWLEELQEYKQISALEEVREAVEKHNECKNCAYKIHSERISKLNNCNNCGLLNTCVKRPEYGDYCRINCYDWSEKE